MLLLLRLAVAAAVCAACLAQDEGVQSTTAPSVTAEVDPCAAFALGPPSPCSTTCGVGETVQTYTNAPPGSPCASVSISTPCPNNPVCDTPCMYTAWSVWSACSTACGGARQRSRSITQQGQGSGAACGATTESETCSRCEATVEADQGDLKLQAPGVIRFIEADQETTFASIKASISAATQNGATLADAAEQRAQAYTDGEVMALQKEIDAQNNITLAEVRQNKDDLVVLHERLEADILQQLSDLNSDLVSDINGHNNTLSTHDVLLESLLTQLSLVEKDVVQVENDTVALRIATQSTFASVYACAKTGGAYNPGTGVCDAVSDLSTLKVPSVTTLPACTSQRHGQLSFSQADLVLCTAKGWKSVVTAGLGFSAFLPAASCTVMLNELGAGFTSGLYYIGSSAPGVEHYCFRDDSASPVVALDLGGDGSTAAAAGKSCASIVHLFRKKPTSGKFFTLDGTGATQAFCNTIYPVEMRDYGPGLTSTDAAHSCAAVQEYFAFYGLTATKRWISTPEGAEEVLCDFGTEGGGWTLVSKVRGNDPTLNAKSARWWAAATFGDPATRSDTNSISGAYRSVPFSDVMVQSLFDPTKRMGLRFPRTYTSFAAPVKACKIQSDASLIFGRPSRLDRPIVHSQYRECTNLFYGFFVYDWTYAFASHPQGCPNMRYGHAGGILGFGTRYPDYPRNDGANHRFRTDCLSAWAIGGGYYTSGTGTKDAYAINAHYWGNGNAVVHQWRSMAVFVRQNLPALGDHGGDGSTLAAAAESCASIKTRFQGSGGSLRYIRSGGMSCEACVTVRWYCDLSGAGVSKGGDGRSARTAALSCKEIANHPTTPGTTDGTYWLLDRSYQPYQIYCNQQTAGGGWTMVAKVKGNSATMNAKNTAQWRDGVLLGDSRDLSDQPALTRAYNNLKFTDVMFQSLGDKSRAFGWRHPKQYGPIRDIVSSCTTVRDGALLFGNVRDLKHPNQGHPEYNPCTQIQYGFLTNDWTYAFEGHPADCWPISRFGHAGGIIGYGTFYPEFPRNDGANRGARTFCMSAWGVGGGYYDMSSTISNYAINAHYWGNGNAVVHAWDSVAVFVR